MDKINNLDDLTKFLSETLVDLQNNDIQLPRARVIAKTAGRILDGERLVLEYQKAREEKPHIGFLDVETQVTEYK